MGDAHVVVIDYHREIVGGGAVAAQDDEVVQVLVLEHDIALHLVIDHRFAFPRGLETDGGRNARRGLLGIAVAPAAVIDGRAPFRLRLLAHSLELGGGAVAAVGMALGQKLQGDLPVPGGAGELVDWLAVPAELQPGESVEDGIDRRLGGALAIGIFYAQQELAAAAARIKPVEKRRSGPADVEEAGGRRGKAGDNGAGHEVVCFCLKSKWIDWRRCSMRRMRR